MNKALQAWSARRLSEILRDIQNGPPGQRADPNYCLEAVRGPTVDCDICGNGTSNKTGVCIGCTAMMAERRSLKGCKWAAAAARHISRGPWQVAVGATLEIAAREGRLAPEIALTCAVETGHYICDVCGLRHFDWQDSLDCCQAAVALELRSIGILRRIIENGAAWDPEPPEEFD